MRRGRIVRFADACSTKELLGLVAQRLQREADAHATQALILETQNHTAEAARQNALAVRSVWGCETLQYVLRVHLKKETPHDFSVIAERFEKSLKMLAAARRRIEQEVRARG